MPDLSYVAGNTSDFGIHYPRHENSTSISASTPDGLTFPMGVTKAASSVRHPIYNPQTGTTGYPYTRDDMHKDRMNLNIKQLPTDPQDIWDVMNRDFPDSINDPIDINTQIIIAELTNDERWPMRLFPMRRVNKLEFQYTAWIFNETAMTRVPEESVGRYSSEYKTHFRESLIRIGHQIKMERNHMSTAEGALEFIYKLKQIAFAIEEGNCYDILIALLSADNQQPTNDVSQVYQSMNEQSSDGVSLLSKFRHELDTWALLNKGSSGSGIPSIVARTQRQFEQRNNGKSATHFILPSGAGLFYNELKSKQPFLESGKSQQSDAHGYGRHLILPDGVQCYESRAFRLGNYIVDNDPMIRQRYIGTYFWMNLAHLSSLPWSERKTFMLNTEIFDEPSDNMVVWDYLDHFGDLGLYDNWNSKQDVLTQTEGHPSLSVYGRRLWGEDIHTYADMYNDLGPNYLRNLIDTLTDKPECIQQMIQMSQIPFEHGGEPHLDEHRPYTARHLLNGTELDFTQSGEGHSRMINKWDKQLQKATKKWHSVKLATQQSQGNPHVASHLLYTPKGQQTSTNRFRATNRLADDDDGLDSTDDSDSDSDNDRDAQKSRESDDDGDVEIDDDDDNNSSSLQSQVDQVYRLVANNDQVEDVGLKMCIELLRQLDNQTYNRHAYLKQCMQVILQHRSDPEWAVPGLQAWKTMSHILLNDELNACLKDVRVKKLPQTELEVSVLNTPNPSFFRNEETERTLVKELNKVSQTACYSIQLNGHATLSVLTDPYGSITIDLPQPAALTTLTSCRLVLCHLTYDVVLEFLKQHNFGFHLPQVVQQSDSSYLRGEMRLTALHYCMVLSSLSCLVKTYISERGTLSANDEDQGDNNEEDEEDDDDGRKAARRQSRSGSGLLDKCISLATRITTFAPFKGTTASYLHNIQLIERTFEVAGFQLALKPYIRSLIELTHALRQGVNENKVTSASRSAFLSCVHISEDPTAFIHESEDDSNPRTGAMGTSPPSNNPGWAEIMSRLQSVLYSDRDSLLTKADTLGKTDIVTRINTDQWVTRTMHHTLEVFFNKLPVVSTPQNIQRVTILESVARLAWAVFFVHPFEDQVGKISSMVYFNAVVKYFSERATKISQTDLDNARVWREATVGLGTFVSSNNAIATYVHRQVEDKAHGYGVLSNVADQLQNIVPATPTRSVSGSSSSEEKGDENGHGANLPREAAAASVYALLSGWIRDGFTTEGRLKFLLKHVDNGNETIPHVLEELATSDAYKTTSNKSISLQEGVLVTHLLCQYKFVDGLNSVLNNASSFTVLFGIAGAKLAWLNSTQGGGPVALDSNAFLWLKTLNNLSGNISAKWNTPGDRYDYIFTQGKQAASHSSSASGGSADDSDHDMSSGYGGKLVSLASIESVPRHKRRDLIRQWLSYYPIEDGRLVALFLHNDVPPPYGYVNYRPWMCYNVGCALAVYSTEQDPVGFTGYMPFLMTIGEDATTQTIHGQVTGYMKPIAPIKQRIFKIPDIYCKGYEGGNSIVPIAWYNEIEAQEFREGKSYGGDVICTPRKINFECTQSPLDIKGSYQTDIGPTPRDQELCYYPLGDSVSQALGIQHSKYSPFKDTFQTTVAKMNDPKELNTLCFQGCQKKYNPSSKKFDLVLLENGHWGKHVGPGCTVVRSGIPANEIPRYPYNGENIVYIR